LRVQPRRKCSQHANNEDYNRAEAGAAGDVERCRPILDGLGQQTFVVGAASPVEPRLFLSFSNMLFTYVDALS
jgi:hypothetical protein